MNQIAKGLGTGLGPVEFREGFLRNRKKSHQLEILELFGDISALTQGGLTRPVEAFMLGMQQLNPSRRA